MESIQRLSHPFLPAPLAAGKSFNLLIRKNTQVLLRTSPIIQFQKSHKPILETPATATNLIFSTSIRRNHTLTRAGWFMGLGEKKQEFPDIMKAGDPVLHEPAQDVPPEDIGSERIQKIIDDMVKAMRKAPGVGLAAPQIGVPLKNIYKSWEAILVLSGVISIGFLIPDPDLDVTWRGPRKSGMFRQLLKDVYRGQLDFLVVDTPPRTSDEHIEIVQLFQKVGIIDGAIVVVTP